MNIKKFPKREEGQGLVEYALVLVLVAIAVIVILTVLGTSVVLVYARAIGGLSGQMITGTGNEGIALNGGGEDDGSGNCTLSGEVSVVLTQDGKIVTGESATVTFSYGSSTPQYSVTVNKSGIGKTTMNETIECPAQLKVLSWN